MPCQSPISFESNKPIVDFTNSHPYVAKRNYRPEDKRQLVGAIIEGEKAGGKMKARGASYSLSEAADAQDFLITTGALNRHLGDPMPHPGGALPDNRYRGNKRDMIPRNHATPPSGWHWIHVEAGIRIRQLLVDLETLGMALPTMGAGGDQTLAGAVSTGTHGSNVDIPPLSDFIRAIHLVGPGGQEWWIEPADGVVGPDLGNSEWCPETFIVRDDEFFRAALVSVGRLGVIYSVVLEVRDQYWLQDESEEAANWSDPAPNSLRSQLLDAVNHGYDDHVFATKRDGQPLKYYSAVIDLASGQKCWVTRRWETFNRQPVMDKSSDTMLCGDPSDMAGLIFALKPFFTGLEAKALAIPFVGLVWAPRILAFWAELMDLARTSETVGDFLLRASAKAVALPGSEVGPDALAEIRGIVKGFSAKALGDRMKPLQRGPSASILDQHDYNIDHCYSGDSAEFFFDARKETHLLFVDDVIKVAQNIGVVPGYISLRYTKNSLGFLAMERFGLTVAIEVAVPKTTEGEELYQAFVNQLHATARKHDGIPHWGQSQRINGDDVKNFYGANLERFRWPLAEVQTDFPATFSSPFTVSRGLELPETKTLADYRSERSGGVLVSSMVPLLFA